MSLIDDLDAMFGKTAQSAAKSKQRAAAVKAQLASPAPLASEMAYAAHVARNFREREIFKPIARVHSLVHQTCQACGHTTTYVAGEWIKFQSPTLHAKVISAREAREPEDWILPLEVQERAEDIHRCPECIRDEQQLDTLLDKFLTPNPQLEMFP